MNAIGTDPRDDELARKLQLGGAAARRRAIGRWILVFAALALLVGGYVAFFSGTGSDAPSYIVEPVTRGDLVVSVSATGNLQPINKVDVGSELSGTIEAVLVDENDRVKKGQVLARLDTSRLRDQVAKSRAAVASAESRVRQVQATVELTRSSLERLREVARLSGGKVPSKSELETAEANLARAIADEAVARALVAEARAVLRSDETNLGKGVIRSPIDGVVLNRRVERGQTVAASLQAPILLTLAEDLSQMELQVDVDEADVGQVSQGQPATFTVDAYPGRRYPARIERVGYGSQVKEGVVSYLAVLTVDNADLSLRPGMTATAEIITLERGNVLLVPNAALRYRPRTDAPDGAQKKDKSIIGSLIPHPPSAPRRSAQPPAEKGAAQQIWVLREGSPTPVSVIPGATDGRYTEIVSGALEPGMEVVIEASARAP